jgi:hypothetical protein
VVYPGQKKAQVDPIEQRCETMANQDTRDFLGPALARLHSSTLGEGAGTPSAARGRPLHT